MTLESRIVLKRCVTVTDVLLPAALISMGRWQTARARLLWMHISVPHSFVAGSAHGAISIPKAKLGLLIGLVSLVLKDQRRLRSIVLTSLLNL